MPTSTKRLFLFGAGASRGAGPTLPCDPPLGTSLYAGLRAFSPLWRHMPAVWDPTFAANFEDGMLQLWNHGTVDNFTAGSHVSRFLHDMARYFSRFRPLPGNAYGRLVSGLDAAGKFEGTVFATLNYECLLEESLRPRTVNYFDRAPSGAGVAACWKLHGSWTFVPESEVIIDGISFRIDRPLGLSLKVIEPDRVAAYCDTQTERPSAFASPLAPSMAVFAPNKPFPFQPKEVMRLQEFWRDALSTADSVVVVGVRPLLADRHVWVPLGSTGATVFAVGGLGDKGVFDAWAASERAGRPYRYLGDGFSDSIDLIVDAS